MTSRQHVLVIPGHGTAGSRQNVSIRISGDPLSFPLSLGMDSRWPVGMYRGDPFRQAGTNLDEARLRLEQSVLEHGSVACMRLSARNQLEGMQLKG